MKVFVLGALACLSHAVKHQQLVQQSASDILDAFDEIQDSYKPEEDERTTNEILLDYQQLRMEELKAREEVNALIFEAVLNQYVEAQVKELITDFENNKDQDLTTKLVSTETSIEALQSRINTVKDSISEQDKNMSKKTL